MAGNDAAKAAAKAAFAADPVRLVQALGLRVDDRASRPPGLLWVFDGNETKASMQIGGRPGTEGLCTRYGAGDEKTFDCFGLVQRCRPQMDFPAALAFVGSIYGIDTDAEHEERRVVRWEVREADGTVIARHCRRYPTTGPRDRWWEPPEGGKGGLQGRAPKTLPLYGLPELLQQPAGTPVVIAEGEKATDAVRAAGLVAVGTYGTSCNPTDEVLSPLLGYLPILWPDADVSGSGERHMQHIADRLAAMGAEQILRADWPDAPDTGDAADTTSEHICQLVAAAQPWERRDATPEPEQIAPEQAAPTPRILKTIDPQSLYDRIGAIQWEWNGWMPRGFVTMVCGPPGAGKSALMLHAAGSITTPYEWPDGQQAPEPGGVLWVDCEGSVQGTTERAVTWGINRGMRIVDGPTDFIFDDPENIHSVAATAKAEGCRVVVIDALSSTHRKDENSSEMRALLTTLGHVAAAESLSIVLIHHLRKRGVLEGPEPDLDRVRGSSAIVALCRSVVAVWQPTKGRETRNVQVIKANFARAPEPFGVDWVNGGLVFGPPVQVDQPTTARNEAEEWLRDLLRTGARRRGEVLALAQAAGFNERTIDRAKREMGLVVLKGYDHENRCSFSEWGLPA